MPLTPPGLRLRRPWSHGADARARCGPPRLEDALTRHIMQSVKAVLSMAQGAVPLTTVRATGEAVDCLSGLVGGGLVRSVTQDTVDEVMQQVSPQRAQAETAALVEDHLGIMDYVASALDAHSSLPAYVIPQALNGAPIGGPRHRT